MIKARNLAPELKSMVTGLMVGNVYYVGYGGDNAASGESFKERNKNLGTSVKKLTSFNHDYILCFGSETGAAAVEISAANAHIIGASVGIGDTMGRGYAYTCPATVDTLQPTTAANYLEIANIKFICHATDHILIDDAGAADCYFHHNTVYGSTTASDAIRLDLEGARWAIIDNTFILCKLAIDIAGAACEVRRNLIHDVDTGAKGIVFGANAHYCTCIDNLFNLSGGTGDVGITIAASADNIFMIGNHFHTSCNDNISDSGTATFMSNNLEGAITGTSGASLPLAVVN